jgi:hypothetical protein
MTLFQRCILGILPISQALFMAAALRWENLFWVCALGAFFVADIGVFFLLGDRIKDRKTVFLYSFPFLTLSVFSFGILLILESTLLKIGVIGVETIIGFVYLLNVASALFRPEKYEERSFANISATIHSIVMLYSSVLFFGLQYYIDFPIWYLIIPFLAVSAVIFMHMLWTHGIQHVLQHRLLIICFLLLVLELIFSIQWLPVHYTVNAFIVTVFFYIFSNLIISSLRNEVTRSQVITYFIIGAIVIVCSLGTSFF